MKMRSAIAALAFALAASAASPVQLEAQRRVNTGITRPSQATTLKRCLAQKSLRVLGYTALGYLLGHLFMLMPWPEKGYGEQAKLRDAKILAKLGAIGGFWKGIREAAVTPCL
jgi:hypothetical protein